MKLALFGASGRTGRHVLEQALAQGHEVTALVRQPSKLAIKHERLAVVQGDSTAASLVEQVVAGQEAVISVLGPSKSPPRDILTQSMRNITGAMQQHGLQRLIMLTGAGVPDPQDRPKLVDRLFRAAFKLPVGGLKEVMQDSLGQVAAVKASGLDWVIVRGPRLNEDPPVGKYRVGYLGPDSGIKIGRADLAEFILKQLTEDRYLRQMPVVSY